MLRKLAAIILAASLSLPFIAAAQAAPKKDFKICWSIYVGWMPWTLKGSQMTLQAVALTRADRKTLPKPEIPWRQTHD